MVTKQKLFLLLQQTRIPPTDKIFPWVVETALTRIDMSQLKAQLLQTDSNLHSHPIYLQNSLELVLAPYLEQIGHARISSDNLTKELQSAAMIDASISQSGWRGIGVALSAIFKHQNLMIIVGVLMFIAGTLGFFFAWKLGESNRAMLERNKQILPVCNKNWASDPHHYGWYTCPLWQLPMPEHHS